MVSAHVGETGATFVEMHDAQGNVTKEYDDVSGIQWISDDPSVATVLDDDADPRDAKVTFLGLGTTRIRCSFDGRVGPDVNQIECESEEIEVVPGEAVAGVVKIAMTPI